MQVGLLAVLVSLEICKKSGLIPPPSELLQALGGFLERGGWPLLLLVSFVEHLAGVNVYFPGSVVIFVAVSSLTGRPLLAIASVSATATGAILAHQVNYLLGRQFRRRPEQSVSSRPRARWQTVGVSLLYWHPHFGALASIAAGREGVRYGRAFAVIALATVVWQSVWGVVAYNTGGQLGRGDLGFWPMVGCVVVWAAIDVFRQKSQRGGRNECTQH
jgi:membrane protein DedA with SNARE-associated domain